MKDPRDATAIRVEWNDELDFGPAGPGELQPLPTLLALTADEAAELVEFCRDQWIPHRLTHLHRLLNRLTKP